MPGASRLSACALTKKGDATETTCLSRAEVVLVFKKSNTKGGCFQQQKVNYVSSATISYEGASEVLEVLLDVAEGDPDA